jgi:hypothetical protein
LKAIKFILIKAQVEISNIYIFEKKELKMNDEYQCYGLLKI